MWNLFTVNTTHIAVGVKCTRVSFIYLAFDDFVVVKSRAVLILNYYKR